ncbi:actin depolymerizing factor3 [Zea mays]|uniref:Actin depolymerizing factor3 n=1 Tax=Zea mays TaxID=4577 RepID=A0A1D6L9V0_MAIZE|nr:actin depolymerizing factor3 [Zea mays]ONM10916.1 actin depolymerizing factor3 [Zea mays]
MQAQTRNSRVASMAFRLNSRPQMRVKSASMRSRIGHARRTAIASFMVTHHGLAYYCGFVRHYRLGAAKDCFGDLWVCCCVKRSSWLPEDHEGLDLSCNSLLSANYVWTMDMCCAVQLTTNK